MKTKKTYKIYFAGGLFTNKDLIGNAFLAQAISEISKGKYLCLLPQNLEQRSNDFHDIRDQDLLNLLDCDLAIFNYDGNELDSGTVVEYMFAKFADIPSILFRSDFRGGGDQDEHPWNLMTSFFPRTEVLLINSMRTYKKGDVTIKEDTSHELIEESCLSAIDMCNFMAKKICTTFDKLLKTKPIMPQKNAEDIYMWINTLSNFKDKSSKKKLLARAKNRFALK